MAPRETAGRMRNRSSSRSAKSPRKGKTQAKEAKGDQPSVMNFDGMRKEITRITLEEEAQWPEYYKTICFVTGLKKAQDLKSLLWMAIYFSTAFWLWNWDAYTPPTEWQKTAYGLVYFTNVYFSFIGAVITHNTMHQSMFRWAWANKLVQVFLSLTYGHPVSSYVPGHNLSHHKYTQSRKDVMNTHLLQHKSHLKNFFLFQPTVTASVAMSDARYLCFQHKLGLAAAVSQTLKELTVVIAAQVACLYLSPSKFLLYWFVPHFIAQYGIVTLNMLQHDGCEEFYPGQDQVNFNTSRNYTSPLLNFLAFNNGYHTIHHLAPTSHWTVNKALHLKLVLPHIDKRLDQISMLEYWLNTYVRNGNPWNVEQRHLDYKGVEIVLRERESKSKITYDEWLDFPASFDQKDLPESMAELGPRLLVLVCKFLISPLYSMDPTVRMI